MHNLILKQALLNLSYMQDFHPHLSCDICVLHRGTFLDEKLSYLRGLLNNMEIPKAA